jgi:hypothetical protein
MLELYINTIGMGFIGKKDKIPLGPKNNSATTHSKQKLLLSTFGKSTKGKK